MRLLARISIKTSSGEPENCTPVAALPMTHSPRSTRHCRMATRVVSVNAARIHTICGTSIPLAIHDAVSIGHSP